MKIAVMMRAMDQDTGFGFWIDVLLRKMFRMGAENSYLLLFKERKHFGRYSEFENVKEVLLSSNHKLIWDQLLVPLTAWREAADIIYNPKFSVPIISHCPVAMGLQEPAWWAIPEHHTRLDVFYMRTMLPLYCRKSSHLFPGSEFILAENRKYLRLPLQNATVTYTAPDTGFEQSYDAQALQNFRGRHGLPEKFILNVTRVENLGNKSATFSGTKNVETTLRAFCKIRGQIPHKLVIVGRRVKEYLKHVGWKESDFQNIQFTGFIPHDEVPKLYLSADLFVLPSFYEGCPNTMIEAMTCGCPVVASKTGPCLEIGGRAAILADPYDPSDFATKMLDVLTNEKLKTELRRKSLQRAESFNWERTARLTLDGLRKAVTQRTYTRLISTSLFGALIEFSCENFLHL